MVLIVTGIAPLISKTEYINDKILRLHILANSDENYDQELKLKVRDYILLKTKDIYTDSENLDDALNKTKEHINDFEKYTSDVIKENGYNYTVKVTVDKEYYNTRNYDDFYMPAGVYNSLKIVIGEGNGHNWWCVMYPTVCISGCVDDFDDELTPEEKEFLVSKKFVPKFKIVEVYEKIKYKITNW